MSRPISGSDPGGTSQLEDGQEQVSGPGAARLRRGSGAAVRAAVRLDQRTHLDEARYRVVLRIFGSGIGEAGWSFVSARPEFQTVRGTSKRIAENRVRAMRRARSRLRHLILATKSDHLLTLTYRDNVVDFGKACSDLAKFVRVVKQRKRDWSYIAVAERQKRGAWHWHLAVRGRQDVGLLRATWRRVVGDGNIDVAAARSMRGTGSMALVRYLGKYLAKGFDEDRELNGRRFRASHGIQVPTAVFSLSQEHRGEVVSYALQLLLKEAGQVGHVWQAEDRTAGWACSWD
jgi:hypothetical protein